MSAAGSARKPLRMTSTRPFSPTKTAPPLEIERGHLEADRGAGGVAIGDCVRLRVGDGPEFDGAGVVGAEGPLDLVHAVGAPIGHFAAGVVAPLHPTGMELRIVRAQGSLVEPEVPIQTFGHR